MPATLAAQRTTVSVEKLLEVIVGLISEVVGGRDTEHLRLRIAIWRIRGEPNWQARIATLAYDPGDVLQCGGPCRRALRSR